MDDGLARKGRRGMIARRLPFLLASLVATAPAAVGMPGGRADEISWRLETELGIHETTASPAAAWSALGVAATPQGAGRKAMIVSGAHDVEALRRLLYGGLPNGFELLGGTIDLTIHADATRSAEVRIDLACNPSTGSDWEVVGEGWLLVRDVETVASGGRHGAPGWQSFWVRRSSGAAPLRFAYSRPWRKGESASRRLDLRMAVVPERLDLTDPRLRAEPHERADRSVEASAPATSAKSDAADLPAAFDWRGAGIVPAVRDQGSCGACWAFAATGVSETAVSLATGTPPPNDSEQYLVSCDVYSDGCNGGWQDAIDLHVSRVPASQLAAGPVLERDLVYTATDGVCARPFPHQPKLLRWQQLVTSGSAVPDEETIKRALLLHGPLDASICAGRDLVRYTGGVFAIDEKSRCPRDVNHDLVLVGWDDADDTWIARNSWGTDWGELGYLRIRRGISIFPSWPMFAVFDPAAEAPPDRANDDPGSPEPIDAGAGVVDVRVRQAIGDQLSSPEEPSFPGTAAPYRRPSLMVWYSFTPPADGLLTLDTFGSNYDTIVGLWTWSEGAFALSAWNDDWAGLWSGRPSFVQRTVLANVDYRIGMASYDPKVDAVLDLHLRFEPGARGAILDDSESPGLSFTGWWRSTDSLFAYGSRIRVGRNFFGRRATARLVFDGTRIAVVFAERPLAGVLQVRVDGVLRGEIAQGAASYATARSRRIFELADLAPGSHVLELSAKNARPVNVDAIVVGDAALPLSP